MTVNQRGEQTAINISWDRNVVRLRQEMADRFLTVPVAFDLVPVLVATPTAIAMRQHIRVSVLEGSLSHGLRILYSFSRGAQGSARRLAVEVCGSGGIGRKRGQRGDI